MTRSRDSNLDLLRSLAILAVIVYHIYGMWPTKYLAVENIVHLGKYGVTLFFVLSGWLIGGIYWRDLDPSRGTSTFTFWVRRWLRTIPHYYAGMTLGYIAVRAGRDEPFDFRYLYFGQNYEQEIPYYLVSWSLCVEEHFYLLLPFVGAVTLRVPKHIAVLCLWMLPLLSPLLRLLDPYVAWPAPFGYSSTATHLVAEGLALGVASAFTSHHFPIQWGKIQSLARYLVFPSLILFVSVAFWDAEMEFFVGQTTVALCCFVWLAATVAQRELPYASSRVIYAIAVSSYSLYLTHSLAIHIGLHVARASDGLLSIITCLSIWVIIIASIGSMFYYTVERTSIQIRDRVSRYWLPGITSPPQIGHSAPK